jgi:uncharacterized membrane protein YfcA
MGAGPVALAGGFLAGVLSGAFGIGGGIVLVPLLVLLLGLGQHEAQGVTLAVLLLPMGLPAVIAYHRMSPIRWRLVGALIAGFASGVGLGSLAANHLPERPLQSLFVLFLATVAVRALRSAARGGPGRAPRQRPPSSDWNGLWIGALGGALSGLLGIGGGLVMVPLLVAAVGLSQHQAQGTSLATMLPPIGIPGVLVYARAQGGLPWSLMAAVALGFAGGAFLGARLAVRTGETRLARVFALFALCVAAALAWKVLRA